LKRHHGDKADASKYKAKVESEFAEIASRAEAMRGDFDDGDWDAAQDAADELADYMGDVGTELEDSWNELSDGLKQQADEEAEAQERERDDTVYDLNNVDHEEAKKIAREYNQRAAKQEIPYRMWFSKEDGEWQYEEKSFRRAVGIPTPFRKKGFSGLDKNGHLWVNGRQVKQGGASRPASAPRSTGGGGHRYYTAPKRSTPKGGLGPLQQRAELIADILGGIYGDRALSMVEGEPGNKSLAGSPLFRSPFRKSLLFLIFKAWDALDHPRGANGRFIPKGSAEAVSTAKEAVKRTLKEKPSSETAKKLADHLSILTVKQLHPDREAVTRTEAGIQPFGERGDEAKTGREDRGAAGEGKG